MQLIVLDQMLDHLKETEKDTEKMKRKRKGVESYQMKGPQTVLDQRGAKETPYRGPHPEGSLHH